MAILFRSWHRPIAATLGCLLLAQWAAGCVARREFHCISDAACINENGLHGVCEVSGICNFGSQGGSAGVSGNGPGPDSMSADAGAGAGAGAAPPASGASGGALSSSGAAGTSHSAGASDAQVSDAAGAAGAACTDSANGNCYTCTPETSEQFLNACTSSGCVPFDDHARLTKLTKSGELPPLPGAPAP
jgi:hypothetical protein